MATPKTVQCCIAGGGPAGLMLGYLLARAGVYVVVLEKHADFLRDFRGDTIHPSTLEVMYELGLLDRFLKLPHQKVERLAGQIGDTPVMIADFRHLPVHERYIAMMPQWDFLNFMAEEGRRYPGFHLDMKTEATDPIEENGKVVGLRANAPDGVADIRADLVVAADGRSSVLREKAGLTVEDLGAPMDALWFRLPVKPGTRGKRWGASGPGIFWRCSSAATTGSAPMSFRRARSQSFRRAGSMRFATR